MAVYVRDHVTGSLDAGEIVGGDTVVFESHMMFLDGVLIPAEHLVDGVSFAREHDVESVEHCHVERDSRDVLVAEGAAVTGRAGA